MTRAEQQWLWMWSRSHSAFYNAMNDALADLAEVDEDTKRHLVRGLSDEELFDFDMMYCGGGPL